MIAFIVHLLLNALLLWVAANLVAGMRLDSGGTAVVAALVLGIANALVRPLLVVLTFPLTVITLGLFLFVVNAIVLRLTAFFIPGFGFSGWGAAIVASLVLTVLNAVVALIL